MAHRFPASALPTGAHLPHSPVSWVLARDRLLHARYRTSGAYRLVPYDQLDDGERRLLGALRAGDGVHAVLTPRLRGRSARAVDRATAELHAALEVTGGLPPAVADVPGGDGPVVVARLVLDGVLAVEHNGRFTTGPDACACVFEAPPSPVPRSGLAALSQAAVAYGASLALTEPIILSRRLYRYNTLPVSPAWRRRFPSDAAVAAFVGLERFDVRGRAETRRGGWLSWDLRGAGREPRGGALFKLYVSPRVEALPEAVRTVHALVEAWPGVVSLKVGANLRGILRPDKLVVYFDTRAALDGAAETLAAALGDLPAHGVPFTAGVGDSLLLSWGIDPPGDRPVLAWLGVESWRLWLTNHIAAALLLARAAGSTAVTPEVFAESRLSLEGVDPHTWTPTPAT